MEKLKRKIKKYFEELKRKLKKHIEDILIFLGWGITAVTTFLLNVYIGLYYLGISLIGLGIFLIRYPRR